MPHAATGAVMAALLGITILSAQQTTSAPQSKPDTPAAVPARPVPQLVNVKIDLTITDQREGANTQPKVVSLVVGDRENGRIRTGSGDLLLNVDARPEIVRDNRIRVFMTMEYRPARADTERNSVLGITESLTVILDEGKPLLVSQSADPSSNRTVKVELKATVLR